MPRRLPAVLVSLALTAPLLLLAPPASATPAVPAVPAKPYDFDGDGFVDLAVGAFNLAVAGSEEAGALAVLPASASGLGSSAQLFTAESPGIAGVPGTEEDLGKRGRRAGTSTVTATPTSRSVGSARTAGPRRPERSRCSTGRRRASPAPASRELVSPGGPEFDTGFGGALAAADFDGDGRSDLAVGWGEYLPGGASGTVVVFDGSASGLAQDRNVLLRGRQSGGSGGYDEEFGSALAVGDLDEDGHPDLVVGSYRRLPIDYGGAVSACYGSTKGLTSCSQLAVRRQPGPGVRAGGRQRLGLVATGGRRRGGTLRRQARWRGPDLLPLRAAQRDDRQPQGADPGQQGGPGQRREG